MSSSSHLLCPASSLFTSLCCCLVVERCVSPQSRTLPSLSLSLSPLCFGVTACSPLLPVICSLTNQPFCLLPSPRRTPQLFCEVYNRNPASLLEEQIERARRRVSQLQLKIQQETGGLVVSDGSRSSRSPRAVPASETVRQQLFMFSPECWPDP